MHAFSATKVCDTYFLFLTAKHRIEGVVGNRIWCPASWFKLASCAHKCSQWCSRIYFQWCPFSPKIVSSLCGFSITILLSVSPFVRWYGVVLLGSLPTPLYRLAWTFTKGTLNSEHINIYVWEFLSISMEAVWLKKLLCCIKLLTFLNFIIFT